MDDALRARVHLTDSLPPGTWELVFVPTFHPPLGVRVRGAEVELWTERDLELAPALDFAELTARANALPLPAPAAPGGRDGLLLLLRTARGEGRICTSDEPESAWLTLGDDVLAALEPVTTGPLRRLISDLRRAFA